MGPPMRGEIAIINTGCIWRSPILQRPRLLHFLDNPALTLFTMAAAVIVYGPVSSMPATPRRFSSAWDLAAAFLIVAWPLAS